MQRCMSNPRPTYLRVQVEFIEQLYPLHAVVVLRFHQMAIGTLAAAGDERKRRQRKKGDTQRERKTTCAGVRGGGGRLSSACNRNKTEYSPHRATDTPSGTVSCPTPPGG